MAVTVNKEFYGLDCIIRHDYEDEDIQNKLKTYQKKSYSSFMHFLTNVPKFKYNTFLDLGCGDDYVLSLAEDKFSEAYGIDLYPGIEYSKENLIQHDWYKLHEWAKEEGLDICGIDAIFINHSLEHAANVYALMQQVAYCQQPGQALFVAVPDGNSPFGYAITSSTTHFSCITEGYLRTTLQRFGYNVEVERKEFREGAPELWAYGIKMTHGHRISGLEDIRNV